MKKFICFLSIVLIAKVSSAQISYGVQGAVISSSHDIMPYATESGSLLSWKAGLLATIPTSKHFSLMPQLNIVVRGGKSSFKSDVEHDQYTEKLTYLELPVYCLYTIKSSNNSSFFIGGGPIITRGITGKVTGTNEHINNPPVNVSYSIKFDNKEPTADDPSAHYKPYDFAMGFIAGYQFSNGLLLNAHYSLTNTSPSIKNYYAGFGVGYMISRK